MRLYRTKSRDYSKFEHQNRYVTNHARYGGFSQKEPWTNGDTYALVAKKVYVDCPISRRCIDIRSEKIRSVDIKIEKGNDYSRRLLERPNFKDRTLNQLLANTETELLVGGDGWLFLNTTAGRAPTLELLRQDFMFQKPNENRIEYDPAAALGGASDPQLVFITAPDNPDEVIEVYQRQNGRLQLIEGNLLHLMHFNPLSASSGSGSADAVLRQIDTWMLADRLINRRFAAGGRNQGAFTIPDTEAMSDEEYNKLRSKLEQMGDLREIEWVADGTEFISTQMSFTDLDVVKIRNQLERNIASAFAVPAVMLNMEGEASYANQRGVDRIFYTGVLEPRVSWMLSHIQAFLRDSTDAKRLVLSIDESQIEYLKIDKMEVAKAAADMEVATMNELREMLGMETRPDGDEIVKKAKAKEKKESGEEDTQREVSHNADTSRRNATR